MVAQEQYRVKRPADFSNAPTSTQGKVVSAARAKTLAVEGEVTTDVFQSQLQCLCEFDERTYLQCFSDYGPRGYPSKECTSGSKVDPACIDYSMSHAAEKV